MAVFWIQFNQKPGSNMELKSDQENNVYIIYIRIKDSLPMHRVLLSTLLLRARNTTLNKDD